MGGGGSPSNTTSTTKQQPPDYVVPYLQDAAKKSQDLYNQGPQQYYPGQTVTPFSSETEQALQGTAQRAMNGSQVVGAAKNFATNTLSSPVNSQFGGASNPYAGGSNPYAKSVYDSGSNPHLDATFNRAADSVQNRLQSGFAGHGRNIDAGRPVAAQELNDLATGIYGGAYESDRNRQMQADLAAQGIGANSYEAGRQIGASGYENERSRMLQDISGQRAGQIGVLGAATGLADQDYKDLGQLGQVGATREDLASRQIADNVSRYDFAQNAPGAALDQYIARLNNQPGGSSSSTTPYFRNRAAGGLGGAAVGYGLGGGWGALAGGLLGAYG